MPRVQGIEGLTMSATARRITDIVMERWHRLRSRMTKEDSDLAPHLRGNDRLHDALTELIRSRIRWRESLPVPSDPLECKGFMERNDEMRWLLRRLDFVYRSPVNEVAEQGEQPEI